MSLSPRIHPMPFRIWNKQTTSLIEAQLNSDSLEYTIKDGPNPYPSWMHFDILEPEQEGTDMCELLEYFKGAQRKTETGTAPTESIAIYLAKPIYADSIPYLRFEKVQVSGLWVAPYQIHFRRLRVELALYSHPAPENPYTRVVSRKPPTTS